LSPSQKINVVTVLIILLFAGAFYAVFSANSSGPASPAASAPSSAGSNPYEIATDRAEGAPDAAVTVIEYASVTCPHCAVFQADVFPKLKQDYIDTGKIRYIFRELPTAPGDWAKAGFLLARCVPEERYFGFLDVLFSKQAQWIGHLDVLQQIARASGINAEKFDQCISDQAELDRMKKAINFGVKEYGVKSTPTFVINGKTYENMPWEQFQATLDPLLAK